MKKISSRLENWSHGIASGVTLGIVAGQLWAPPSGKRTREDLKNLATNTLDQAGEWMDSTKESLNGLFQ